MLEQQAQTTPLPTPSQVTPITSPQPPSLSPAQPPSSTTPVPTQPLVQQTGQQVSIYILIFLYSLVVISPPPSGPWHCQTAGLLCCSLSPPCQPPGHCLSSAVPHCRPSAASLPPPSPPPQPLCPAGHASPQPQPAAGVTTPINASVL